MTFEASVSAAPTYSASVSATLNAGTNANPCVLAAISTDRGGATTIDSAQYNSVAMTANAAFNGVNGQDGRLFYKLNAATGSHTLAGTLSDANTRPAMIGAAYSGVDTSTGVGAQTTGGSGGGTTPSVSVASAVGETVVAFVFYNSPAGITQTPGSGVTARLDATTLDQIGGIMLEKSGAAGNVTINCTLSATREWWMVGVSLKPAGGAGITLQQIERGRTLGRGLGRGV